MSNLKTAFSEVHNLLVEGLQQQATLKFESLSRGHDEALFHLSGRTAAHFSLSLQEIRGLQKNLPRQVPEEVLPAAQKELINAVDAIWNRRKQNVRPVNSVHFEDHPH